MNELLNKTNKFYGLACGRCRALLLDVPSRPESDYCFECRKNWVYE